MDEIMQLPTVIIFTKKGKMWTLRGPRSLVFKRYGEIMNG